MCLAVPLTIKEITGPGTAVAERDGVRRKIDVSLLKNPEPGDYVIVHAGFAIEKVRPEAAADTLAALEELREALRA